MVRNWITFRVVKHYYMVLGKEGYMMKFTYLKITGYSIGQKNRLLRVKVQLGGCLCTVRDAAVSDSSKDGDIYLGAKETMLADKLEVGGLETK